MKPSRTSQYSFSFPKATLKTNRKQLFILYSSIKHRKESNDRLFIPNMRSLNICTKPCNRHVVSHKPIRLTRGSVKSSKTHFCLHGVCRCRCRWWERKTRDKHLKKVCIKKNQTSRKTKNVSWLQKPSVTAAVGLFNNQTTSPSFLRADSQRGAAELTIARRKRGRVV